MSDGKSKEPDALALEHAWRWFEYHANQRMTMIRFYLLVAGAIASGTGYLWINGEYFLSTILSAFGFIASICFMRLDKRVSGLVKLGEDAMVSQQSIFARTLCTPAFEICRLAGELRTSTGDRIYAYPYTYGENFRLLFCLAAMVFAGVCALSARFLII